MSSMQGELRNNSIYLDFTRDPSLAAALADKNVGEKCTLDKVEVEIISKDAKGLAGSIEPGDIVPEGYEKEESEDDSGVTTPPPQPPGSQATAPVTVAMNLRRKGAK